MTSHLHVCYQNGVRARQNGKPRDANPYKDRNDRNPYTMWKSWDHGWEVEDVLIKATGHI
jgi:hypothetical protein